MDEGEQHIGKTEARAGTTPHMNRYILPISVTLVVILFALIIFLWLLRVSFRNEVWRQLSCRHNFQHIHSGSLMAGQTPVKYDAEDPPRKRLVQLPTCELQDPLAQN